MSKGARPGKRGHGPDGSPSPAAPPSARVPSTEGHTMRLTPALRLLATALLLFAASAALWWLVGFQIGKGVLSDSGGLYPFRTAYGFEQGPFVELLALALVASLAREIWSGTGAPRWLSLAGLAFGAALLLGERSPSPSSSSPRRPPTSPPAPPRSPSPWPAAFSRRSRRPPLYRSAPASGCWWSGSAPCSSTARCSWAPPSSIASSSARRSDPASARAGPPIVQS
jgi:hypothetical protein